MLKCTKVVYTRFNYFTWIPVLSIVSIASKRSILQTHETHVSCISRLYSSQKQIRTNFPLMVIVFHNIDDFPNDKLVTFLAVLSVMGKKYFELMT